MSFNETLLPPEDGGFDYGHYVITTKSKIRGTGRAVRLRFESEPGKDMHILGWSIEMLQENEL